MAALFTRKLRNQEILLALLLGSLILLSYGLFLAHRIDLTVADLGRHLQNGKMLFEDPSVWNTNFYSYTAPDYPVINHHWLSGLLFFFVWRTAGFIGLHLFFIGIGLLTLLIFLGIASEEAGVGPAALISILALPLLAERTEIRPEAFSYLFAALFLWILLRYRDTGNWRILVALPMLEILWVNTHIYFFLGPALMGAFLVGALVVRPFERGRVQSLFWTLAAGAAATLLNPFGLHGAAAPFTIFQNYGYRLAENQPVWFIEKILYNPNFTVFKVVFALLLIGLIARLCLAKDRVSIPHLIIAILTGAMGWLATRNFALFGFFFIPLAAANLAACCGSWLMSHRRLITSGAAALILLLSIPAFFGQWQKYFPYWHESGVGLEDGSVQAAEFFRKEALKGPIFNNYDIGGYLIWGLFPQERVFVDNRPEAYPSEFFSDTYVPMQESDEVWRREMERWRINAIFFSHRDMTPWGQRFLVARVSDPEWAPVYADRYAIIFLKRNEQNQPIIEQFEIPQSAFRIVAR